MGTDILSTVTDSYKLRARVAPGVLAIAPILSVPAVLPKQDLIWSLAGSVIVVISLSIALANIVRDRGAAIQDALTIEWGGWPSTVLLRCRSKRIDAVTKRRYKSKIATRVTSPPMPTEADEERDPEGTDAIYASIVKSLLEQTRGDSLLFEENVDYGFRRNCLGIRRIAVLFSMGLAAFVSVHWVLVRPADVTPHVLAILFDTGFVAFWLGVVRSQWVCEQAYRYAFRLFAVCDGWPDPPPPPPSPIMRVP